MPIHTIVAAAFFASGRRNIGTPFEIASTPVSATAPDENPFRSRKKLSDPPNSLSPSKRSGSNGTLSMSPANDPIRPITMSNPSTTMYTYVGIANRRPDSLIPRMFASVISAMRARPSSTRCSASPSNAGIETIAATPAEIDTATVRM